ncbi:hypothetical protein ACA910_009978 [Epithemia clementina (nom. ined.)]
MVGLRSSSSNDDRTKNENQQETTTTTQNWFWQWYQSNALGAHAGWYDFLWILVLWVGECGLGAAIIYKVPYTEIDWIAYMQEVQAVVDDGQLDYRQIRGDTGPLVYPAGFVYLFALLRHLTNQGESIALAQLIFLGFYVATQMTVLLIYGMMVQAERQDATTISSSTQQQKQQQQRKTEYLAHRIWGWRLLMGVLCLSKRLHSIYLLRLFNDGPTMLLLYISILLFMKQFWQWGCCVFSLAVSVKMNVLLFAPGLLLLLLQSSPTFWNDVIVRRLGLGCALPQLVLGAPFLATYPLAYLRKAFELDRVFFHQWTVNFKFLPNDVFVSKPWALFLLSLHLSGLLFLARQWLARAAAQTTTLALPKQGISRYLFLVNEKGDEKPEEKTKNNHTSSTTTTQLAPDYIAYTMMVSNFVGIAFARTLHYQFYSWYFHALPLLMWYSASVYSIFVNNNDAVLERPGFYCWRRFVITLGVMAAVECAFLTFPATPLSSAILQMAHVVVLWHIRSPPRVVVAMVKQNSRSKEQSTGSAEPGTKKLQ